MEMASSSLLPVGQLADREANCGCFLLNASFLNQMPTDLGQTRGLNGANSCSEMYLIHGFFM